jgi:HK97 gp10 family phage protein
MTQNDFRADVDGAEELERSLNRLAGDIEEMPNAGQRAGQAVRQRASSLAPKLTGALSRSIRAEVAGAEVAVGSPVRYAPYQEYGTATVPASPYLRPALEAATTEIVQAYYGEVEKELGKVKGA